MILYLRNSLSTPAESGFVPQGLPSFDSSLVKGYHYDPVKSRQLLAEAGFPDGKGLPVIKLLTIAVYADMADFIAKQYIIKLWVACNQTHAVRSDRRLHEEFRRHTRHTVHL